MRITIHTSRSVSQGPCRHRRREEGSAVIVILVLLVLLCIYVTANMRTLYNLGHELKSVDQRQTRRLENFSRANVLVTATNLTSPLNPGQL